MEDYIIQGARNHIHGIYDFDEDNVKVIGLEEGRATVEATMATGFSNTRDFVHGGVLMAICDMTASAAVYTFGKRNITLQSSFNFTRGVPVDDSSRMICDARVVHNGRQTAVVEVEIRDPEGRICVRATFTQFIIGTMSEEDPIPLTPLQKARQM